MSKNESKKIKTHICAAEFRYLALRINNGYILPLHQQSFRFLIGSIYTKTQKYGGTIVPPCYTLDPPLLVGIGIWDDT